MSRGSGRSVLAVLEPAVAIGQAEVGRGHLALGAVRGEDADRLEHSGDVGLVGAGVGPHGAADRARDGQPELEAGQAGPLRLGRRTRHLDAGFGRVAHAVGARALGPDLDDQPADPRVGDDHVAPPPEDDVLERARASEANEGAQLVGVVDRREQVGRAADAHRREPGERLVAGRLDPDPALDVGAGRDRVEARDHAPDPRASRSMPAASGKDAPVAAARTSSATASAAPGLPSDRAAADIPACASGSSSSFAASRRASASNASSSISLAAPASTRLAAFARWWPAACGIWHDDHRHAEGGHLGQRRGPGPADDEIGRGQRGQHLVAQERVRPVAPPDGLGQAFASGQRGGVAFVAGHVDDGHPLDQAGQGLGDRRIEAPDGLRPAEDEQDPFARGDVHPDPGGLAVDRRHVADRRAGDVAGAARRGRGERPAGGLERHRQRVRQPRRGPHGPAGDDVAVPQHDRDPQRGGGQQDGHGHVAAGREHRSRSLLDQDRRRLRDREGKPDRIEDGVQVEVGRSERSRGQAAQRDAGRGDEVRLEAPVPAQPAQLGRLRAGAERPGDGERRVDVSARPACRDQQSHRRSTSPSPPFHARSTAGSRPPQS